MQRKELSYRDAEGGDKYVPYVIEPSAGVDRSLLAFIIDAYEKKMWKERRERFCICTIPGSDQSSCLALKQE